VTVWEGDYFLAITMLLFLDHKLCGSGSVRMMPMYQPMRPSGAIEAQMLVAIWAITFLQGIASGIIMISKKTCLCL